MDLIGIIILKKKKKNNFTVYSDDSLDFDKNDLKLILPANEIITKCKPIEDKSFNEICDDIGIDISTITKKQININTNYEKKLTPTKETSYKLFMENKMSIDLISKARGMKKQTIEDHLVECINCKRKLDLNRLEFSYNIYRLVFKTINSDKINNNISKLKPIKNLLPRNISYLHIKLTIAMIKSKNDKFYFKKSIIV